LRLKALQDILFFCENKFFLNIKLWDAPTLKGNEDVKDDFHPISQKQILSTFYKRNDQGRREYDHLIIISGMRASKTTLSAIIGVREVFELLQYPDPAQHFNLISNSDIYVMNVATDEKQGKQTVFRAEQNLIDGSPYFKAQEHWGENEIHFSKNIHLQYGGCNSSSIVGRTTKCAVFDEISRFRDTTGSRYTGQAVYESLERSTKTFAPWHEGITVVITSPISADDYGMELYRETKGKPGFLNYHFTTWELNPYLSKLDLQPEFDRNSDAAWRDFGARPAMSIEPYYKQPEIIMFNANRLNGIDTLGKLQSWALGGDEYTYVLGADPGEKRDAFGIAFGHLEWRYDSPTVVGDIIHAFRAKQGEINPIELGQMFVDLKKRYPTFRYAVFDINMYPEAQQRLREVGVMVEQHFAEYAEHEMLKELFHYTFRNPETPRIDFPESELLGRELKSLSLIRGKKVDHSKNGTKDLADATALMTWKLLSQIQVSKQRPVSWVIYRPIGGLQFVRRNWEERIKG